MKKLLAMLAVSMFLNQASFAEAFAIQQNQLSQGQYLAGGLTSLFVGWGVGHAIQGRYAEKGWIFTVGEAASTGLFFGGYGWFVANAIDHVEANRGMYRNSTMPNWGGPTTMMVVGGLALSAFRIWEVIDAFTVPYSNTPYASATKPVSSTKLAFAPWIAPQSAGFVMNF